MPFARPDADTETLELHMHDKVSGCDLYLYYTVFPESDVISRRPAHPSLAAFVRALYICVGIPMAKAFAFGGIDVQQALLESEGIVVKDGLVDLKKYRHNFNS